MSFKLSLLWLLSIMNLFAVGNKEENSQTAQKGRLITGADSNSLDSEQETHYDDLLSQTARSSAQEKRKKLSFKAQQIFISQTPWVPLSDAVVYTPVIKSFQSIHYQPSSS